MTPKVTFKLGSEVLQASALHNFFWPDQDPEKVVQSTRFWSEAESDLLNRAVGNYSCSMEQFQKDTRTFSVAERIWRLITSKAFNFNGVESVRNETFWLDRVRASVIVNEPIVVAYPLVCKINNPAKRISLIGFTAGERAIIRFFKDIGRLVRTIYEPGIRIRILSDATLYNGALQVPPPSAYHYMSEFARIVAEDGASDSVELLDYTAALAPFHRDFEVLYNQHYTALAAAPLSVDGLGSLPTSVRTNINTRRYGFTYYDLFSLFGPRQVKFLPARAEIDQQAIFALREQLAIKMACVDLDLPGRLWPRHIRATCHKGTKDERHVLGLRPYPQYYAASKLLPYHGMPLIESSEGGAPRLLIVPEISLRGDPGLVRVIGENGDPLMYCRG